MPRTNRQRPSSWASVTVQIAGGAGDEATGGRARREPVDDLGERAAAGDEHALEVEHLDSLGGLRAAGDALGERRAARPRRARARTGAGVDLGKVRSTSAIDGAVALR